MSKNELGMVNAIVRCEIKGGFPSIEMRGQEAVIFVAISELVDKFCDTFERPIEGILATFLECNLCGKKIREANNE